MELPVRLFGLWALLFCATSEGDAAPTGECRPSAQGRQPRGGRGSAERRVRVARGRGPRQRWVSGTVFSMPSARRRQPPEPVRGGGHRSGGAFLDSGWRRRRRRRRRGRTTSRVLPLRGREDSRNLELGRGTETCPQSWGLVLVGTWNVASESRRR